MQIQTASADATYAAYAGMATADAQSLLNRIGRKLHDFETVRLNHWRDARVMKRQAVQVPAGMAASHLDKVLADFEALAVIMADLRAKRDAAVADAASELEAA